MDLSPRWHILQISDVLDEELASALSQSTPVTGWVPEVSIYLALLGAGDVTSLAAPASGLQMQTLRVPSGYARLPASLKAFFDRRFAKYIRKVSTHALEDVLVCTTPYFAGVAERWPGPVVYWLTDLIARYESARGIDVPSLDRRMCAAATLVCPNSARLAEYLQQQGCDERKITIVPNATRQRNTLAKPPLGPAVLEEFSADPRPVAGVIGNLAGNMDWVLLQAIVRQTPWLQWVFVGPTTMPVTDKEQRLARASVQQAENTRFPGKKPYGSLARYARGFHVAVLPYLRCEPTYSGSSTRFYEHLAACRPMLATRGFEELLRKEPLLTLVNGADEAVAALEALRACGFDDGRSEERWRASLGATWEARAATMQEALVSRLLKRPSNYCPPSAEIK